MGVGDETVKFRAALGRLVRAVLRPLLAPASRRPLIGASLATAGLLWLAYFPVAWGWLGWVALVPLLCLVRARETFRFLFLCAWMSGLVFFVPVLWWMHAADGLLSGWIGPMTAASYALAIYCALYFPAAVFLLRRLERYTVLPLAVSLPLVWTGLEFVRSFLGTGFPWYFLGHTQQAALTVIQVSDLGGAYTVTLLLAAVNAVVFEWLYLWPGLRQLLALREPDALNAWRPRVWQTLGVAAVLVVAVVYGNYRLTQDYFEPGPRLCLLQGDVEQRLRNHASSEAAGADDARQRIVYRYSQLALEATQQKPDLVVWPETSYPLDWYDIASDFPNDKLSHVPLSWDDRYFRGKETLETVKKFGTPWLLGLTSWVIVDDPQRPARYNSALLVTEKGQATGRYDKIHRVPFGEYVPLRDWLPFMDWFSPYNYDYGVRKGSKLTRFTLGKHTFGVLICFEDGDPELARRYGTAGPDGPAADFLVEISNDGWFDGTCEHEEHLALCRFRAIETRRSIARAVNMGISAVVDGNGRVLQPREAYHYAQDMHRWEVPADASLLPELPQSQWADFKKVQGVLTATMPIDRRTSLYSLWGDWLPWSCWAVVGGGLGLALVRRRWPSR
jgi:apolipoprotein N-acyltransferase